MSVITKKINYHDNGNIESIYSYKGNILHGRFAEYEEDGSLSLRGNYKNGLLHGEFISYYEQEDGGGIHICDIYVNGHLHGKSFIYDEDGELEARFFNLFGDCKRCEVRCACKETQWWEVIEYGNK